MLNKKDAKMAQGLAVVGMVMLHLFCRIGELPYMTFFEIGGIPLIYYIGLFGDLCVPVFCFCSGYAQEVLVNKDINYNKNRWKRLLKFILHFELILLIFSIIGLLMKSTDIPVSLSVFIGNMLLYGLSYNGAWWFVITYIFLIIIYPYIRKVNDRINPIIMLCLSFALYFIGYIFEFKSLININNAILNWIFTQMLLVSRTQLPFVAGMIVYKYSCVEKLKNKLINIRYKNLILAFIVLIMFVSHCHVQSLIVAPFTGIVTIMCFHLWDKPVWIENIFAFLGKHSTNIWLTHMFFYLILFRDMVFKAKYPLFILLYMLSICIIVSIIINSIENLIRKQVQKYIDKVKNVNE